MADLLADPVADGPAARRPFGRTGLSVTPICIGTSPLASMPALYGYAVDDARAEATVDAVLDGPFNFLDTSNNYGGGSAERRIGAVVRRRGLPDGFVLATKADADPDTGDFSGERVRRSVAESLERLGVDHVPVMYLHDPEYHITFEEAMAPGGAVEALVALREEGVVGHLGVAGGPVELMRRFVRTGVFEAVINHNRWTLVDRAAGPLIEDAAAHGVAFVNGAPYGGGMLVKGPDAQPRYAYRETGEPVRDAVRAMLRACAAHDVPLAAAALQFSLRDPRVTSTIVGVSEPERVAATLDLATTPIPAELWDELDRLTPPPGGWLE
ncbi:oxidoreductase [Acrocarpospora phusangensis]|uniref:Oxidoreductase n=1 Tax=Acrocarpospora phusangensis TaxID=1070424 RepID=A0A919Q5R7_9ACTN|nr:aldo/keto reductase [Acrocarpospora phusangensis]GIH21744.1 oxidoreductase [Acrocarpospora phusangensis]